MLPRKVQMFSRLWQQGPNFANFPILGSCTYSQSSPFLYQAISDPHFIPTGRVIWTPCLINIWLYKPQIFQGITDTLQGLRKHKICKKNLLYGYYGNCLITWCFSLIIVKTSMKNRYFSNAPRNHKLEGIKIKRCVMIVLFLCFSKKVTLRWVGVPYFWEGQVENRAKCGKIVIFSGLKQGIFPGCP